MCSILLKNYWLDRIDRRKQDQIKQSKLNGIVEGVVKRIKLSKDKKTSGK